METRRRDPDWKPTSRAALALACAALVLQACAGAEPPPPAEPAQPPAPTVAPVPAPPAPPVSILGPDGELVVNAMEYPWSAIGRLNAGGRSYCTGVLIAPREVLAPAACLYNAVEGRPWAPAELHFVAGYQRDAYLLHAPVASYRMAPGFDPAAGATLASAAAFWAVATLDRPLGEAAGWLGLAALDRDARAEIERGEAVLFQAGYRRATPHVITAFVGCSGDGGGTTDCRAAATDPDLPFLLVRDGAFHVVGNDAEDNAADGQAPARSGPADAVPRDTIEALLRQLGFLANTASEPDEVQRRRAIVDFQRAAGLAETGEPSVALLGALIRALHAPALHVSWATGWVTGTTAPRP